MNNRIKNETGFENILFGTRLVMGVQNTWSPIESEKGVVCVCTKLTRQIEKYLIIIGNNQLFGHNISTGNLATVVREGIGLVLLTEASVVVPLTNKAISSV